MNRIDLALVAAVDEVLHHRIADLAVLGGGADHGNGLRLHDAIHRLDDVVLAGTRARRGLVVVDHDADIRGNRTVLGGEDRIEVKLGDLRIIVHKLRNAHDHIGERVAVDRIAAAHALQHLGCLDAVKHRERLLPRDGRKAEGNVLQDLDENAAKAEGDQLAERAVGDGADDDFLTAGQHLLDLHANDLGVGLVGLRIGNDRIIGGLRILGRFDADNDAAGLGLVKDVRGDDLHDHRKAHAGGQLGCFLRVAGDAFLRNLDAIDVAQQLAFRRGERLAPFRLHLVQHVTGGGSVEHVFLPKCRPPSFTAAALHGLPSGTVQIPLRTGIGILYTSIILVKRPELQSPTK